MSWRRNGRDGTSSVTTMRVWIGTSGYSYSGWVGEFYPEGTPSSRMLSHYGRHFPLVELNFTFYKAPTRATLTRLADKAPPGFQFLVKLPKTISHDHSPLELPGFRHAVEGLARRGQLAGLLAQFPQAMHCTRPACDWVTTLARELSDLPLSVEFRHRSWFREGLPAWLAEKAVNLVAVDAPSLPGLFPRGFVRSTSTAYVRLHSRDAGKWYAGGSGRYDYDYTDEELGEWVDALLNEDKAGKTEKALVMFDNCHRSQATVNAKRMRTLLAAHPQLDVVPAFAPPLPVQKTLFGG